MAYTWKQKKAVIREVLATALKLDVVDTSVELADGTFKNQGAPGIQWENERWASRPTNEVWCDLRLGNIIPLSTDEVRYDFDEDGDRLLPTYGGPRRFSVMVIVATDDQENYEAVGEISGRLRTRLVRDELLERLVAVDVGFERVGQTLNVDYMDEGVMYSQAMTEVWFQTNEQDEPEATTSGDYIAYVDGGGTLTAGADGEDIETELLVDAR